MFVLRVVLWHCVIVALLSGWGLVLSAETLLHQQTWQTDARGGGGVAVAQLPLRPALEN